MKTIITDSPAEAAEFIRRGGIVAFPTETVYGLGADVFNESAIEKIFEAKKRPADNPLIVHISATEQLSIVTSKITESARKFVDAFFPGPLTIVLNKQSEVPLIATAGLETVGIRMPENKIARSFLKSCGTPVVAPSANISGRPSPTTWTAVLEDLDGRIDCILKGEATEIGLESTVVDCTGAIPIVLRPGAVSIEQLRGVMPNTIAAAAGPYEARSPGMRHKHYSPIARVLLIYPDSAIDHSENSGFIGVHDRGESFVIKSICPNIDDYARGLFEFFRECDRKAVSNIYCETVSDEGIGTALMDRLRRASKK